MRYGILSDVHGNLEALTVVLERLRHLEVDTLAFLGDAVGYGANPDEVCTRLRQVADIAIVGNHDAAVVGRMDYGDYYEAARRALDWCAARLGPENRRWLEGLPYVDRRGDVLFCHGAPFAPEVFDYVFAADQILEQADHMEALPTVTFIGHSHLTISFRIEGDLVTPMIAPHIEIDPAAKYIITVGSVGQPRDRDPRACCGVFDTDRHLFTYYRYEYDLYSARQKILDAGLPPVFGDRLLVGV